jgi:outer membrane protein OmpA-like peptidoglycan-associated protein
MKKIKMVGALLIACGLLSAQAPEAPDAPLQADTDLEGAVNDRVKAEADKTELRSQLLKQFSTILETRDSVRGLIIKVSDELFDTAKYSLAPVAREKLAKVAGVVSRYPGLKLKVEGHTDNMGEEEYNQRLSEQRGEAVRTYLIEQGVAQNTVTTRGFGGTQPAASNQNAAGRRQNRRVELVVSGDIIGGEIGSPTAAVR